MQRHGDDIMEKGCDKPADEMVTMDTRGWECDVSPG